MIPREISFREGLRLLRAAKRRTRFIPDAADLARQTARLNRLMLRDRLDGRRILVIASPLTIYAPFFAPVLEELRKRNLSLSFYVLSREWQSARFDTVGIPIEHRADERIGPFLPLARGFMATTVFPRGPRNAVRIHIPHNQPVKFACQPREDFEHFHAHFLVGPLHREQAEFTLRTYALDPNVVRLIDVGYPKSDRLLSGHYERRSVLEELGLDPTRKTVIYAPSFEHGLSLRSHGTELVEALLSVEEINLIVKLHPVSNLPPSHPDFERSTGGVYWPDALKPFEQNERFRNVVTDNVDPLLAASDVMVTDISGVALEFLCLDRPIVYLDCPDFFKSGPDYAGFGPTSAEFVRESPTANAGRHVGRVAMTLDELPARVRAALDDPEYLGTERREYASKLRYHPGHAAPVVAETILRLLDDPRDPVEAASLTSCRCSRAASE